MQKFSKYEMCKNHGESCLKCWLPIHPHLDSVGLGLDISQASQGPGCRWSMDHTLRNSSLITWSKRNIHSWLQRPLGLLIATCCLHLLHSPCSGFSLSFFGTPAVKRDIREGLLTLLYVLGSRSLDPSVSPRRSTFPQSLAHRTLSS